jgi:hypothetical protein
MLVGHLTRRIWTPKNGNVAVKFCTQALGAAAQQQKAADFTLFGNWDFTSYVMLILSNMLYSFLGKL